MSRERGAVGGVEVLPFSLLVFVTGTLVVAAAWGAVDARLATAAATREAVRTFAESDGSEAARASALGVGEEVFSGHGRDAERLELRIDTAGTFERCAVVRGVGRHRGALVSLPFGVEFRTVSVEVHYTEIVDPLRGELSGEAHCVA